MPGLVPSIQVAKAWMAGTGPVMTEKMLTGEHSCANMVLRGEGDSSMRASTIVLAAAAMLAMSCGSAYAQHRSPVPVYPPYPYKAGHYPTVDSYYDLPPYAAIDPRFYRRRFFLMAQERNRYRYMPHIFRGYRDDGEGSYLK
jgi:hypothetical protein